ncbi:DNA polymerase nu-like [Apostichopus japonicus]|uniref:DNA polymerase nu-like n=1 Tax=Stichopus japonicus TaxID=307972 RepID=UPI003AB3E536
MSYVWKPVKDPPSPRCISQHSPDIQRVLRVIRSKRVNQKIACHSHLHSEDKLNQVDRDGIKCEPDDAHPNRTKISSKLWQHDGSSPLVINPRTQQGRDGCSNAHHQNQVKPRIAGDLSSIPLVHRTHLQDLMSSEQSQRDQVNLEDQEESKDGRVRDWVVTDSDSFHSGVLPHQECHKFKGMQLVSRRKLELQSQLRSSGCSNIEKVMKKRSHPHDGNINKFQKRGTNCSLRSNENTCLQLPAQKFKNLIREDIHHLQSTKRLTNDREETGLNFRNMKNSRNVISVDGSRDQNRQELLAFCVSAAEILLQFSYANGVTQLQEKTMKRLSLLNGPGTVDFILVAVHNLPEKESEEWTFLSIPILRLSQTQKKWCQQFLRTIMSSDVRKICYDSQEVISVIITFCQADLFTVASRWICLDPRVACWLLDPDNPPNNFSDVIAMVVDRKLPGENDEKRTKKKESSVTRIAAPESDFSELSKCMRQLYHQLCGTNLWNLFLQVEMPLIPLLSGMELSGIKVDPQKFYYASTILKTRTSQLEQLAYAKAGKVFQLNSHVQLRQVLFDDLKLDEALTGNQLERTTGQNLKSTSENVLTKLQDVHPLPGIILEYRKMQKLKSTYVDGYIDFIRNSYIHCTWEQTAAVSGRLQSTNPNVQNIPKQPVSLTIDVDGQDGIHRTLHIREPFVSRDGYSLISADFQSIELRLLAHYSDDDLLLGLFKDEEQTDIFIQMTSQWLGVSIDRVRDEDREKTKRIVYSIVYGAGSEKIAEILKVDKKTARSFTNSFLDKFSGIKRFTQQCIAQCHRLGCVRSLLNRQRLIKNISSANISQRLHAERQAVNFVIQGSAADLCKLAMLTTVREFAQRPHLKARLLIQIHDELLFEAPDHQITECKELISSAMESVSNIPELGVNLKTTLPVSLSVGKDWGHLLKC